MKSNIHDLIYEQRKLSWELYFTYCYYFDLQIHGQNPISNVKFSMMKRRVDLRFHFRRKMLYNTELYQLNPHIIPNSF